MGTIADKFEYLLDTKAAIKNAIVAKGVEVESSATFRSYAEAIGSIESGGNAAPESLPKGVNFYDYDGTLLHGYTVAEAQALTELPPLPEQEGLICQSWNWSLAEIKALGREVDVYATYITDDGKTRIYITLSNEDELEFSLKLNQSEANAATVDWGDGSTPSSYSTVSDSFYAVHTYASVGEYCVEIDVPTGKSVRINGSASTNGICKTPFVVRRVNLGANIKIGNYAFSYCKSLSSITIPNSVTSFGTYAFNCCASLSSIAIPDSLTSIGTYSFYFCSSLSSISIPNGITFINNNAFQYCSLLSGITIPNSVTVIGSYAFSYCTSLSSVVLPNGITGINTNAFQRCTALTSITIPSSVTSIANYAFNFCMSILSITIPSSVRTIGATAFGAGYFRKSYHFQAPTPPSLSATAVFLDNSPDFVIYVPTASVNAYKTAANWSAYANKIVGE